MKRVLDVGQCHADHGAIRRLIEQRFAARVESADDAGEALEKLRGKQYHLVLVNRLLDTDASEGLEIIRTIKADPELQSTAVMLVTNYAEHQAAAVAAGAEPGFGKSALNMPETLERIGKFVG